MDDRASSDRLGIGSLGAPYGARYSAPADSSSIITTLRLFPAPRNRERSSPAVVVPPNGLVRQDSLTSAAVPPVLRRGRAVVISARNGLRSRPFVSVLWAANGPSPRTSRAGRIAKRSPCLTRPSSSGSPAPDIT